MAEDIAMYEHNLENRLFLRAYSLDPKLSEDDLRSLLSTQAELFEAPNLDAISNDIMLIAKLSSFGELEINVSKEDYKVPNQLKTYRAVLENDSKRKKLIHNYRNKVGCLKALQDLWKITNGGIIIPRSEIGLRLEICKGGFFDFKATELSAIPSCLVPTYPEGKTIKDLLPEYRLKIEQLGRYIGFAFIMLASNGGEISFVQRAKEMGVATDCIALSGLTPKFDEGFYRKSFNFQEYFESLVIGAMAREYKLDSDEFRIGKSYFMDDKRSMPFIAIEIKTPLSTEELAKRCYGDKDVLDQHNVLYSVNPNAVNALINNLHLYYSSAKVLSLLNKKEHR